jgi:hypothetical protein
MLTHITPSCEAVIGEPFAEADMSVCAPPFLVVGQGRVFAPRIHGCLKEAPQLFALHSETFNMPATVFHSPKGCGPFGPLLLMISSGQSREGFHLFLRQILPSAPAIISSRLSSGTAHHIHYSSLRKNRTSPFTVY